MATLLRIAYKLGVHVCSSSNIKVCECIEVSENWTVTHRAKVVGTGARIFVVRTKI